jgi:hypothetical protein
MQTQQHDSRSPHPSSTLIQLRSDFIPARLAGAAHGAYHGPGDGGLVASRIGVRKRVVVEGVEYRDTDAVRARLEFRALALAQRFQR